MFDSISVENMRRSDALTIEKYCPSLTLMYRAAMGVYSAMPKNGKISIVCGGGNNGGDGFALACILADNGIKSRVYMLSGKLTPDSRFYYEQSLTKGVECIMFSPSEGQLEHSDIIVDCILGTGFKGDVREPFASAIREINACNAFTVSVDINSGMNGDTGEGNIIVKSDLTVTIGFIKHGLIAENAGRYIGELRIADIGIVLASEEKKLVPANEMSSYPDFDDRYILMPTYVNTEIIDAVKFC